MSIMRSHMCGQLRQEHSGTAVHLAGWVRRVRDHGQLAFVDLRDRTGIVQLVLGNADGQDLVGQAVRLKTESVIRVSGTVRPRAPGAANPDLPTGAVEVSVTELEILNPSAVPPFVIDEAGEVDEALRLRYRYLDLRRPAMQRRLEIRHRAAMAVRGFCDREGMWEIETPYLTRSTPEGARDYVVPSRVRRGRFYALPQSPQLFKQMLMVAGVDRYFQIVRCFRDEDLRANRQPEFTQVDVEMSFAGQDEVIDFTERMVAHVYAEVLDREIQPPFPRLTYAEAMYAYGSDKPDPRLGPALVDLGEAVGESSFRVFSGALASGGRIAGLRAPGLAAYSRRELSQLEDVARGAGAGGLMWFRTNGGEIQSPVRKHLSDDEAARLVSALGLDRDDLGLVVAGPADVASASLGTVRALLGRRHGWAEGQDDQFLWVVDFPLLEPDEDDGRLVARHHPFTAPNPADIHLLESDPVRVRARAYDLVLNGEELAGGSERNHRRDIQERVFAAMAMNAAEAEDRFGFFLSALDLGAPPHAGIAMGLERLIMEMTGTHSIRDVIAFPKTATAGCAVTGAPAALDVFQLEELGLRLGGRETE